MASFPNTLIRCIAEGQTPDKEDINEIALHIWKDINGSAASTEVPDHSCKGLHAAAYAALCGSRVPHLDEAKGRNQRIDKSLNHCAVHSFSNSPVRRMILRRLLRAGGVHRQKVQLLSPH